MKKSLVPYHKMYKSLKTGDIVLMHGLSFTSRFTQLVMRSPFSHAAMIILAEDMSIKTKNHPILLWESNVLTNLPDQITDERKIGPMLVDFHDRVVTDITEKHDSQFIIRHLHCERDDLFRNNLKNVLREVHAASFPVGSEEFINFFKGRVLGKQTGFDTFFCSELVAYTFFKIGLLSGQYPFNSYSPKDFSQKGSLALLQRAWLGNEIPIQMDNIQ